MCSITWNNMICLYCLYDFLMERKKIKTNDKKVLTNFLVRYIIHIVPLGNGVTVARQTLTLFVGVRIPIPQPKTFPSFVREGFIFSRFTLHFSLKRLRSFLSNKVLRKRYFFYMRIEKTCGGVVRRFFYLSLQV